MTTVARRGSVTTVARRGSVTPVARRGSVTPVARRGSVTTVARRGSVFPGLSGDGSDCGFAEIDHHAGLRTDPLRKRERGFDGDLRRDDFAVSGGVAGIVAKGLFDLDARKKR